jgi:hypothetical protein
VKRHEHRCLREQDVGVDRLGEKVDGTESIGPAYSRVVVMARRDEHDRQVLRPLPSTDQLRRLEAIHAGHLDVEEDERDVGLEQPGKRLRARGGGDDRPVQRSERGLQRDEVRGDVIDDQNPTSRLAPLVFAHVVGRPCKPHARDRRSLVILGRTRVRSPRPPRAGALLHHAASRSHSKH